MVNLTDEVRLAKTRKVDYNTVVVTCKAKISELEKRGWLPWHINKDARHTSDPEQVIGGNKPVDKFEPISDPEESEVSIAPNAAGKLCNEDSAGKTFSSSTLNTRSEAAEDNLRENLDADTDILVSKEVTVGSTNLDSSQTIFDSPSKLHNILNEAMSNAIEMQLPYKGDSMSLTSYIKPAIEDRTLLSSKGNLQPVVTSVLMSLTQQSFDNAIASTCCRRNEQEIDEKDNRTTVFHDCTENPFTLSKDDPPAFVLPVVVEGKLDLSITEPAVSSVAMEAVNDGIIFPASVESNSCRTSNEISIASKSEVKLSSSELKQKSVNTKIRSNTSMISGSTLQIKAPLSLELVGDNASVYEHANTESSSSETMIESGEGKVGVKDETNDSITTGKKGLIETNHGNIHRGSCDNQKGEIAKKKTYSGTSKKMLSKGKTGKDRVQSKQLKSICFTEKDDQISTSSVAGKELTELKDTNLASVATKNIAEVTNVSLPHNSRCEGRSITFRITEDACDPASMKIVLHKHIQEIEHVKKQLGIPRDNTPYDSHCARTSGLRISSKSATHPASGCSEVNSEANALEALVRRIVSDHAQSCMSSTDLGDLHLAINTSTPLQFSIHEFIFSGGIIKTLPSRSPSDLSVDVTSSLLSTSTSGTSSTLRSCGSFKPYVSPLLMFSSYRSNSNFSASTNGPLTSFTYSSKLDPNKALCQFELTGTCSDNSCTSQHLRDISMSKEEITRDVTSNCPSLVGCNEKELADYSVASDIDRDRVTGKFESYAENFVKQYSGKVSEEEFWKILVHEMKQERLKSMNKRESISFDGLLFSKTDSKLPVSDTSVGSEICTYNFSVLPKLDSRR